VSVNHSELIKELMSDTANTVSKAELMAAITTTRYQQLRVHTGTGDADADDDAYDGGLSRLSKFG
jgi:hypothetical protein